ncbi:hypothetical protein [Actinoplanes sp. NBRC 101535]|uniref:hypothetical protein n=1 Tax=Actinoplanes sp. NBRC 101535 TaxID=3032196 RepID=UPI0024A0AE15|nr:hypothetical protein [Actinoplanes sp. NBRC 101535]GLY08185.1 hypothetical protein Acsp01_85640 [Actinoplanes sp. NBRC 101535]
MPRPSPEAPTPEPRVTLLDGLIKYAVPLLGVVGAVLFGTLRLAYVFFYQPLRATPEEVGYGYLEVLSSQLAGTVELVLLLTTVLMATALGATALRHTAGGRWRAALAAPSRAALTRLARRCALAALIVVLALLPVLAWLFGTEARHGSAVRNIYLLRFVRIPVLAVQASPATVTWTAPSRPGLPEMSGCLLYLGQSGGITVFYDVADQESIRVPSVQIMVNLPYAEAVPATCVPADR